MNQANTQSNVENNYSWWKDKKMVGTIILIVTVIFQIFAFLQVPFLTSIHAYTIGLLFGFYNPFFYFYVAYISLIMIFGSKVQLPNWVKLTKVSYWFVAISIMFIGSSSGEYQHQLGGWTQIGTKNWSAFTLWWNAFTENGLGSAWTPAATNGGVVAALFYSLTSMISSGIGSFILSIVLIATSVSVIVSGTSFGFYKTLIKNRTLTLKQREIQTVKNDVMDLSDFEDATVEDYSKETEIDEQELLNAFPFEDPFKEEASE